MARYGANIFTKDEHETRRSIGNFRFGLRSRTYLSVAYIASSIDDLLRRSTNAGNFSDRLNYSLARRLGYLLHTGWVHSHSFGYRDHRDFGARHSRATRPVVFKRCGSTTVKAAGDIVFGFTRLYFLLNPGKSSSLVLCLQERLPKASFI